MTDRYILRDHAAIPCPDLYEWARWFETANRHVGVDEIGNVRVSTVFLGLNHQWGRGPPLLYETMIFGGPLDGEMWRYTRWDEAETGHKAALAAVIAARDVVIKLAGTP